MTKIIKGFISTFVGVVIGGETIRQIGATSFPSGLGKPTQVFTALAVLGQSAKNAKSIFKFK